MRATGSTEPVHVGEVLHAVRDEAGCSDEDLIGTIVVWKLVDQNWIDQHQAAYVDDHVRHVHPLAHRFRSFRVAALRLAVARPSAPPRRWLQELHAPLPLRWSRSDFPPFETGTNWSAVVLLPVQPGTSSGRSAPARSRACGCACTRSSPENLHRTASQRSSSSSPVPGGGSRSLNLFGPGSEYPTWRGRRHRPIRRSITSLSHLRVD